MGMNTLQALLSFAIAAGLLTMTPGLDTALILRTATVKGAPPAYAVAAGICLGCLIWCLLVSVGLGVVLSASKLLYHLLRVAGAVYLFYLGLQMLLNTRKHLDETPTPTESPPENSLRRWFGQGLLTNLLNPKVGVFYVSFMPQFIPPHADLASFGVWMGLIHSLEGLLWFSVLVIATQPLARWLKQPRVIQGLDRLTGGILILFGAKLALEPSH